mgnify:CR=1 FL=1
MTQTGYDTRRPSDGEIYKMRAKVRQLLARRDTMLAARDFSTLADLLDEIDTAQAELWARVPEDRPVESRLGSIFPGIK